MLLSAASMMYLCTYAAHNVTERSAVIIIFIAGQYSREDATTRDRGQSEPATAERRGAISQSPDVCHSNQAPPDEEVLAGERGSE